MTTWRKQDLLDDLENEIALDVADRDYLTGRTLPALNARALQAMLDALVLARRDGKRTLSEPGFRTKENR